MPSFLFFFFFYVGVCSINLCEEKNLSVLSLVAAGFFWITKQTRARKVSQKCWHNPSETKLVQKERKNLMRKHLRSQKREKINRGKSEFCVQKKFKNFSSVVSSRWSGF